MHCCASTLYFPLDLSATTTSMAPPFSRMEVLLQHPVDLCDLLGIVKIPTALEKGDAMLAVAILTVLVAVKGDE